MRGMSRSACSRFTCATRRCSPIGSTARIRYGSSRTSCRLARTTRQSRTKTRRPSTIRSVPRAQSTSRSHPRLSALSGKLSSPRATSRKLLPTGRQSTRSTGTASSWRCRCTRTGRRTTRSTTIQPLPKSRPSRHQARCHDLKRTQTAMIKRAAGSSRITMATTSTRRSASKSTAIPCKSGRLSRSITKT